MRESLRNYPAGTALDAAALPFEALVGPEAQTREMYLPPVLERGIGSGRYSVDRVLAEVGPAVDVLDSLPYDHAPTRKAAAGLIAWLGKDPVNWLTCYARMGRARGSVAELIVDVTSPNSRRKRCTSWPWPQEAKFPVGHPRNSRAAFLAMFRCATEEVQKAVVPHLDARAVQHLLVFGEPSPAVRDAVVAVHGLPAQAAMAASHHLSKEQVDYLLDLDEPTVDAQLFHHAPSTGLNGSGCSPDGCGAAASARCPRNCSRCWRTSRSTTTATGSSRVWYPATSVWPVRSSAGCGSMCRPAGPGC